MSASKSTFSLLITALVCLAACAEQEKLNEMHDATVKMEKTTGEMNKTTGKMQETTEKMNETTNHLAKTTDQVNEKTEGLSNKIEDMKETTNELYDALRQGNALQLRREAWTSILQGSSMFKKLSESAKYYMSYELQLWNLYGQDKDADKRDILAQQAAQEFFMEIGDVAPANGAVDVTAQPDVSNIYSKENRTASFNALAAAVHQINRKQVTTLNKDRSLPRISMLSLIEEALLAKATIQTNQASLGSKEPFIREILTHEKTAIQILQTRYNLFPMILIDLTNQISQKSWLGKAKMALMSWDLDLDQLNKKQLEYYQVEVLQQAIEAREFLKKIGVKPVMDKKVAMILGNMKIKASGTKEAHITVEQIKLVEQLKNIKENLSE